MLNFKNIITIVTALMLFAACKAPSYSVQPENVVSRDFISGIYQQQAPDRVTTVKGETIGYKAEILEKLVKRDAVTEYKMANKNSVKKENDIGIAVIGKRTELYFYEVEIEQVRGSDTMPKTIGVLFSANFSPNGDCLGFGPLYIGDIDRGSNNTKMFKTDGLFRIRGMTSDGETRAGRKPNCPELVFFYTYASGSNGQLGLSFSQVVQTSKNKISGINKFLVYDVARIFNDPDALSFLLTKTN
ncbi:MAG: hypothetical protein KIT80_04520 [Chitinophagaceae bacterium]|nr:hypothetical protein [Chitinophagaceae bacterium]MCW5926155.1 hypothetical protein [Chitinophagaceae bacterium]